MILGTSPPEPVAEEYEEDAAELEEEEMESIQVSEKEFDFLDFIKRWANLWQYLPLNAKYWCCDLSYGAC